MDLRKALGKKSFSPASTPTTIVKFKEIPAKAREKVMAFRVSNPPDMSHVGLSLFNKSKQRLQVNFLGILLPQGANADNTQRLFVAGAQSVADQFVMLNPGEGRELELTTACLDHTKNPPEGNIRYAIDEVNDPPEAVVKAGQEFLETASQFVSGESSRMDSRIKAAVGQMQTKVWSAMSD